MIFAPQLVMLLQQEKPEVVDYGTLILRWISPFYALLFRPTCSLQRSEGSGDSKAPMVIMIFSFVIFSQIYLFVMSELHFQSRFLTIAMGYPAGWMVCMVAMWPYYRKVGIGKGTIV